MLAARITRDAAQFLGSSTSTGAPTIVRFPASERARSTLLGAAHMLFQKMDAECRRTLEKVYHQGHRKIDRVPAARDFVQTETTLRAGSSNSRVPPRGLGFPQVAGCETMPACATQRVKRPDAVETAKAKAS